MKKFVTITSIVLVLVLALAAFAACGYDDDPKKALENFKKQGYDATYVYNPLTYGDYEGTITAKKDDGKKTTIITVAYYRDSSAAKSAYEDKKSALEEAADYNKEHNIKSSVTRSGLQVITKTVKPNDK